MRPDGNPAGNCGTSVTSSIDAPRATSGVNTARGERPVSVATADFELADRLLRARDVGDDRRALGFRDAQVVLADDAALEAVALQAARYPCAA